MKHTSTTLAIFEQPASHSHAQNHTLNNKDGKMKMMKTWHKTKRYAIDEHYTGNEKYHNDMKCSIWCQAKEALRKNKMNNEKHVCADHPTTMHICSVQWWTRKDDLWDNMMHCKNLNNQKCHDKHHVGGIVKCIRHTVAEKAAWKERHVESCNDEKDGTMKKTSMHDLHFHFCFKLQTIDTFMQFCHMVFYVTHIHTPYMMSQPLMQMHNPPPTLLLM